MEKQWQITAREALELLKAGNKKYLTARMNPGDISPSVRRHTLEHGQFPYAIVITCSDSRVIPEAIFSAGIGELFVIRLAGNVIDAHQLGSIEYAADHLGSPLIVVLGHTHCGAVDAAINHDPEGYIKFITDEIRLAIGDTKDPHEGCIRNVNHSLSLIQHSLEIRHVEEEHHMAAIGAVYDLETGIVEFLPMLQAGEEPVE